MADRPSTERPLPGDAHRAELTVKEASPAPRDDAPALHSSQRETIHSHHSDVHLADEDTLAAPSFPAPAPAPARGPRSAAEPLAVGERIDDFVVEKVLGKGAFGVVYLARQVSLDRLVALKVAANEGSEGRTMARLEHDYIVQVFSESVDQTGRLRLLCMQLVPGASLEGVIHNLHRRDEQRGEWNGRDYLAVVESRAKVSDVLDTAALRDRELLAGFDAAQTAAWVGARLAEAIEYAHRQGVLHRDIKPANVLVNQYGRPMLADFNISFRAIGDGSPDDSAFGGTLAFMAPEHLDAFSPSTGVSHDVVDEQSDVYSLGIVVYELLTGGRPFASPRRNVARSELVGSMAEIRRQSPPPITDESPSARKTLTRVVAKSLAPEKADRWKSGAEFAAALDGCREMRSAELELPAPTWYARGAWKSPFLWLVLLAVGPQIIGSAVNIAYNATEIVGELQPDQRELFFRKLVPWYNGVAYPLLLAVGVWAAAPVFAAWRKLKSAAVVDEAEVALARRRAVALPYWMLGIAAAGWLPGGLLFPWMIDRLLPAPVPPAIYGYFAMSFTLSCLVAVAYSFCGLQILVMQVLYPRMWADPTGFRRLARVELAGTPFRLRLINTLSGAIPLVAAVVIIVPAVLQAVEAGEERVSLPISLLALLLALILLGLVGREITTSAASRMAKAYNALLGRRA